jgi:hypothetical protein
MPFSSRKLMLIMEIHKSKIFRALYVYIYPFLLVSGFCLRLYIGELSIGNIQYASSSFFVPCIFHWLTELDCPGCGITRSLIAMFFWSPQVSFYFHPLGPLLAGLALFYWLTFLFEPIGCWYAKAIRFLKTHSTSVLLVILAWGVFRNF